MTTRRDFLRSTIAGSLAMGAMSPMGASAQVSGYKALVFVLLKGGMDSHDAIVPTGASAYSTWATARESLVGDGVGTNRDISVLRPLGNSGFGFAPELSHLADLYDSGDLAVVANAGPLEEPTIRAQIADGSVQRPPRLASHNDQQSIWQTNRPEGGTIGWGGQFMDNLGFYDPITRVNVGEAHPWVSSSNASGLRLRAGGLDFPTGVSSDGNPSGSAGMGMLRHYRHEGRTFNNVFMQDVANAQRQAYDAADALIDILDDDSFLQRFAFPHERLAQHFSIVAQLLQARNTFGLNRQIFFVNMNGFDVHGQHGNRTPTLYGELSRNLSVFQDILRDLGLHNDVTTVAVTEFGRTLQSNPNGTDHGWGAHQFVMGGAVNGGQIYGEIPPYDFDHDQDWRRGAMIPTTSVEQFAEPLGRWFGVDNAGINTALPNLGRFGSMSESFL